MNELTLFKKIEKILYFVEILKHCLLVNLKKKITFLIKRTNDPTEI